MRAPLTSSGSSRILEPVHSLGKRLSAAVLAVVIATANGMVCAGWLPTPEARMACCSQSGGCPMHRGAGSSATEHVLTQAQANNCCASSERENTNQPNPSLVAAITGTVLGVGTVIPASVPAFVLSNAWRTSAPIPVASVPKHVLLSVFLV
jgi:hypothetical protein